jgi:diaminohydroxyphosphoribosylaminopyrimidine deaminase / 5-amino-6-(5-phosphoribosylamino)uracil reductase
MPKHEEWMRLALREAERGAGRTRPNPNVGCVIVKGRKVLARGFHKKAGLPHAELDALNKLGGRAKGADVYVTLEPCDHLGRTGRCSEALIAAGVRRVFVGIRDPNPLVNGRGIKRLKKAGIEVQVGVLEVECRRLHEAFAHFITTRRPYVIAKLAQSLDGRVATRSGESKWVTSEGARQEGHRLRNVCDAIIAGVGTVIADDPELTCRVRGGRDPMRVIVDSQARTPPTTRVVRIAKKSSAPTLIAVGEGASSQRVDELVAAGAEVVVCKQRGTQVDLGDLLRILGERDLVSVLVEGGPTLLGSFFDAGLVNKVHAFVAPKVIGGAQALGAVGGLGAGRLHEATNLEGLRVDCAGSDLWLQGYVRRGRR